MTDPQESGFFSSIDKSELPLWEHQKISIEFGENNPIVYDASDPGTGKTRVWINVIEHRLALPGPEKLTPCALVLAPKSILDPAWGDDFKNYGSGKVSVTIAYANNREKAFNTNSNVFITNHDGIKWIAGNLSKVFRPDRDWRIIIIDEITAFKHATSQRSKALLKTAKNFPYRTGMSGTPNSNTITDLHHQVLVLDEGVRLGTSFYRFRNTVCEPRQVGPSPNHLKWQDRDGAAEAVVDLLADITIRHVFEDCVDIPEHNMYTVSFELSPKHRKAYETLKEHCLIQYESGEVTAFNAASLAQKLLQMASGAVYVPDENDSTRVTEIFSTDRYNLVLDLVEARKQCVVAFVWEHQRTELVKQAKARGLEYAVLDGSVTSHNKRTQIINQFQAGLIKVLFIHPKTGAHGLTLTAGTSTIWASPIYDAELFTQFNKRIYRGGQTRKTETVMVCAAGTADEQVYEKLQAKLDRMQGFLDMVKN